MFGANARKIDVGCQLRVEFVNEIIITIRKRGTGPFIFGEIGSCSRQGAPLAPPRVAFARVGSKTFYRIACLFKELRYANRVNSLGQALDHSVCYFAAPRRVLNLVGLRGVIREEFARVIAAGALGKSRFLRRSRLRRESFTLSSGDFREPRFR